MAAEHVGEPCVTNAAVAAALAEIAALRGLVRGDRFRPRAFRNAARMIAALPVEITALTPVQRRSLEGIGPAIDRVVEQLVDGATSSYLEGLRADEPPGVGVLVQVMGVSIADARTLSRRGVTDLDGLSAAVADGSILQVPGVGARTAEVIADGIGRLDLAAAGRPVLRAARLQAEAWARAIGTLEGVEQPAVAGEVARGAPQPRALTITCVREGDAPEDPLLDQLLAMEGVICGLDAPSGGLQTTGEDRIDLLTTRGLRLEVRVALHPSAVSVVARGGADDRDPLAHGGGGGAGGRADPDRLIELSDLRGDAHVHTVWSGDGHDTVDELARAAVARGYDWLALTDHAEDLTMNGLSREDLRGRDAQVEAARERHPDLVLLRGLELNIGLDGGLDYDLETLLDQEWCVASIHSIFQRPEAVQTERILAAVAHPAVDAIGHPVGRLLGMRPGYAIDIHAIAQACAETGTALEVNGSPRRLDLDAEMVAVAVAAGAPLVISSDAHRARELDYVVEAVMTARRGGAPARLVRTAGDPPRRGAR